ncbi:MAG: NAD(P) transhydrogenase subunit alpha [Rickettsiales bacterium]|nr:NAD(P) transhydrogenase subunit alpha [Rickettsiales bacterium]
MKLLVLKESHKNENRVALTPELVSKYQKLGIEILVESKAGEKSSISDADFEKVGAKIVADISQILPEVDVIISVQRSDIDFSKAKSGVVFAALLNPYFYKEKIAELAQKNVSAFALELLPRSTRAQSMDTLSSQSNLAGYISVIEAAYEMPKAVPMMMTAAGTISAAKFLILGAGVAGLQAIATAKRLGAIVSAFDVRAAAKEQVQSLGAKFIEVKTDEKNDGVYAKEMSDEYKKLQEQLLKDTIKNQDVVIATALIPGKKAPILISEEMVKSMKAGAIIVDLAAVNGGNCALTEMGKIIEIGGVKIIGHENFPSRIAGDASKLFAKNVFNFIELLASKEKGSIVIDLEDEIVKTTLVTHKNAVTNDSLKI